MQKCQQSHTDVRGAAQLDLCWAGEETETVLTILAWVQAERGPVQHCSVLANIPDVEVDEDRQGGESRHSEPGQHEDVRQHDELQEQQRRCVNYTCHRIINMRFNVNHSQVRWS